MTIGMRKQFAVLLLIGPAMSNRKDAFGSKIHLIEALIEYLSAKKILTYTEKNILVGYIGVTKLSLSQESLI